MLNCFENIFRECFVNENIQPSQRILCLNTKHVEGNLVEEGGGQDFQGEFTRLIGPSGVRALPLAAGINVGGHYKWHFFLFFLSSSSGSFLGQLEF